MTELGFTVYLDKAYDEAVADVTAALKTEGFGVLTEIDVQATLKQKIDVDFRPYTILGACNPPLAYKALSAAADVGLLLPCNVTVSAEADGRSRVHIINPEMMMGVMEDDALVEVAADASARLQRVAAALAVPS